MTRTKTVLIGEQGVFDGNLVNRVYSATAHSAIAEPADHNLVAWSMDPAMIPLASATFTAGVLNLVRLYVPVATQIASMSLQVVTSGASLTNVGAAIYTQAGVLQTSSVNSNGATATAFQSTGTKSISFTPVTVGPGFFYVGFWMTGTTMPALLRGSVSAAMNIGLATGSLRFATADTGRTTTAPSTFGAQVAAVSAYFAAVS